MMFLGSVFIAAFGAAGVLSAIAASSPRNQFEIDAQSYLIGTSVSYPIIIIDTASRSYSL